MAVSKAQQRAVNKYVKNNYDEIKLRMPKGKKEIIQAHAAQRGESRQRLHQPRHRQGHERGRFLYLNRQGR